MPISELLSGSLEIVQQYGVYGIALLFLLEGSLGIIAGGIYVALGLFGFWQLAIIFTTMDILLSNLYYFAGSEGNKWFKILSKRYLVDSQVTNRSGNLFLIKKWVANRYQKNFITTYLIARFVPLTYTTTIANILSGTVISYDRFIRLLVIAVPVQVLLYLGISYGLADGFSNTFTASRLGVIIITIIGILCLLFFRKRLLKVIKDSD